MADGLKRPKETQGAVGLSFVQRMIQGCQQTLVSKPKDYLREADMHEIWTGCTSSDWKAEIAEYQVWLPQHLHCQAFFFQECFQLSLSQFILWVTHGHPSLLL